MNNLDKVQPNVLVEVGGKPYRLEYTMWAVAQYKRLTGKSLLKGDFDDSDSEQLVGLLWAGLLQHHTEFDGDIDQNGKPDDNIKSKLKELAKAMSFEKLGEYGAAIKLAFEQASPKPDKGSGSKKDEPIQN